MLIERKNSQKDRYIRNGRHPGLTEIGSETVETTDWFIGILRFMSGERVFQVGHLRFEIPDATYDNVYIGNESIRYREFVELVEEALFVRVNDRVLVKNPTSIVREADAALRAIVIHMETMVQTSFKYGVPPVNLSGQLLANKLKQQHNDPGGLAGRRKTRPQDW